MNSSLILFSLNKSSIDVSNLSPEEVEYLQARIKPKEIVIIIFMMFLWFFSILRWFFGTLEREKKITFLDFSRSGAIFWIIRHLVNLSQEVILQPRVSWIKGKVDKSCASKWKESCSFCLGFHYKRLSL